MPHRLIRIAEVHYDPLDEGFRGMAIGRTKSGRVIRRPVYVPAPPTWDHSRACRALSAVAV